MRPAICALVLALAALVPAAADAQAAADAADPPPFSVRGFALVSGEWFAASKTFDAGFGQSFQPFWGGGIELTQNDAWFLDVAVSRFRKTGQRAFIFNGQTFRLGIPMTVTMTPIEATIGYRFHPENLAWLVPYAGAGVGSYGYREVSTFADPADNVDTRRVGYLVVGGAEFRLQRWVGVGVDAQYTRITGILGRGGISEQLGEDNLGGVAARLKVIIGR
ncbi:MAG: outer membrane beta-barrel protein [Betaproteobacteria bacterium]